MGWRIWFYVEGIDLTVALYFGHIVSTMVFYAIYKPFFDPSTPIGKSWKTHPNIFPKCVQFSGNLVWKSQGKDPDFDFYYVIGRIKLENIDLNWHIIYSKVKNQIMDE